MEDANSLKNAELCQKINKCMLKRSRANADLNESIKEKDMKAFFLTRDYCSFKSEILNNNNNCDASMIFSYSQFLINQLQFSEFLDYLESSDSRILHFFPIIRLGVLKLLFLRNISKNEASKLTQEMTGIFHFMQEFKLNFEDRIECFMYLITKAESLNDPLFNIKVILLGLASRLLSIVKYALLDIGIIPEELSQKISNDTFKEDVNLILNFERELTFRLVKFLDLGYCSPQNDSGCPEYINEMSLTLKQLIDSQLVNMQTNDIKARFTGLASAIQDKNITLRLFPSSQLQVKIKCLSTKNSSDKFKKENVCKKVLRLFRNHLEIKSKLEDSYRSYADKTCQFINNNLFPPLTYNGIKFRSFNNSYVRWLFLESESELALLYTQYIIKEIDKILRYFHSVNSLRNASMDTSMDELKHYLIGLSSSE